MRPSSPIRPQLKKDRAAAVQIAHRYGRKRKKEGMRPCISLIDTAANRTKAECGRTTFLANTAAIEKRQNCGRANCSSIRPQIGKRRNAAVLPSSPIRPQLKKDRAAAVTDTAANRKKAECGRALRPYEGSFSLLLAPRFRFAS